MFFQLLFNTNYEITNFEIKLILTKYKIYGHLCNPIKYIKLSQRFI